MTKSPMPVSIQPQLFVNHDAGFVVRVIEINGGLWFVAADVARTLQYRDAATATRILDDDEKGTHKVCTPSGTQEMSIISESGFYSLVIRSNKPEARPFRRWVTGVVLPQIRRTGGFGKPVELESILNFLQEEREARIRFENRIYEQLIPAKILASAKAPSLPEIRSRILAWVRKAGAMGVQRRTISNRIRQSPERQKSISNLITEGVIFEIVRNRTHYFIAPEFIQQ